MNTDLQDLFTRNRDWARATEAREPGFFTRLLRNRARTARQCQRRLVGYLGEKKQKVPQAMVEPAACSAMHSQASFVRLENRKNKARRGWLRVLQRLS